ncbi:hypothetical protein ABPG72_022806 [Tetrahymena utriculariae]
MSLRSNQYCLLGDAVTLKWTDSTHNYSNKQQQPKKYQQKKQSLDMDNNNQKENIQQEDMYQEESMTSNQNWQQQMKIKISQLPQVSVIGDTNFREHFIKEVLDSISENISSQNELNMIILFQQKLKLPDNEASEIITFLKQYFLKGQTEQSESISSSYAKDAEIKTEEIMQSKEIFSESQNNVLKQQNIIDINNFEAQPQQLQQLNDYICQQLEESKTTDSQNLFTKDYGKTIDSSLNVEKDPLNENKNVSVLVEFPESEHQELFHQDKQNCETQSEINSKNQLEQDLNQNFENYEIIEASQQSMNENTVSDIAVPPECIFEENFLKEKQQRLPQQNIILIDQSDRKINSTTQFNDNSKCQHSSILENNDSNDQIIIYSQCNKSNVSQEHSEQEKQYQQSKNESIREFKEEIPEFIDKMFPVEEKQKEQQQNKNHQLDQLEVEPKQAISLNDAFISEKPDHSESSHSQDLLLRSQIMKQNTSNNIETLPKCKSQKNFAKEKQQGIPQQDVIQRDQSVEDVNPTNQFNDEANFQQQQRLENNDSNDLIRVNSQCNKSTVSQEHSEQVEQYQQSEIENVIEIKEGITEFQEKNITVEEKQKEQQQNENNQLDQLEVDSQQKIQLSDASICQKPVESENSDSQHLVQMSQISCAEENISQQQQSEQPKQQKEKNFRDIEVELAEFLSNLIESMPITKVLHQKRPALKAQLLEGLQAQYKNNLLYLDSLKKNIKPSESEIFNQAIQKHFDEYQQYTMQTIQDFQEIKLEQSQPKFIQTKNFFKEYFKNEQIEKKYTEMIESDQIDIQIEDLPYILIRDKENFLNKLETKYKEEYKQLYNTYLTFANKIRNPFHLLLQKNYLRTELIKILETKSDIIRDEKGIYEMPQVFDQIQNIYAIKNSVAQKSDEWLENLYSSYNLNEEHLDSYDFVDLIKSLFSDNQFEEWLSNQISNLTQIAKKTQEEICKLSYIEQQIIDQTFYKIIQRFFGQDPNQIPVNFMQCMYTLSSNYIKEKLTIFDDDTSQYSQQYRKKGIINILMPFVQTSLKQTKIFEDIFLHFCDSQKRPEYQLSQKNFMTCVLEKFNKLTLINQSIISYYNKFCQPFSLIYKWLDDKNQIKSKFSLSMFRHYLQSGTALLVSIGDGTCGASTTLNHLYNTNFPTTKHNIFEKDVDIFFNSAQLTVGLNIIDIHGDCAQKKDRMTIILQIAQYYQYWILVQAKSMYKLHEIEDYLKQLNIKLDQVIFLLKDKTYSQEEVEQGQQRFQQGKFIQISQTQNDKSQGQYGRDLAILKREIKDIIGFGKNVKVQQSNKQESIKNYWDMTNEIAQTQSQYPQININLDFRLEKNCKIMMKIIQGIYQQNKYLQEKEIENLRQVMELEKKISKEPYTSKYMEIYQNKKNIKNQIFVNLTIMDEITELQIQKNKLCLKQGVETKVAINTILNKINEFRDIQKGLGVHPLVQVYIDAFCEKKEEELNELEALVEVISQPVLRPIEVKIQELTKELQVCQINLNISEKKYYDEVQNMKQINSDQVEDWVKKEAAKDKEWSKINSDYQELQKKLILQTKLLENSMMSRDLFQREMIYILQSSEQSQNLQNINHKRVVQILKDQFLEGKSIEIIDGNNNSINYAVLKDVFDAITEESKHQNIEFLPVAILGPQSTGKSTLINMIFGCDFKVSSGRCTKGMDISLKKVFYNNKQYLVLVMDTEGLLSIEKADESYDKRLTLLSMACAKKVIVNVNGEINIAMKKILSVALFAGNKLKELSHKPELIFCLRNMVDTDQSKMTEALVAIEKELNEVAKINKVQLSQCLDFKGKDSLVLMRSAFNIETAYSQQDDKTLLYEKITTDQQFMYALETLKQKIFIDAEFNAKKSLNDWLNGCSSCWEAIQQNFDIFMIDSIKEIEDRNCLGQIIKQIKESPTYQPISQSLSDIRSKYEKLLSQQIQDMNINEKCRLELQKSYEYFVEAVSNEYLMLTEGYQNQDLIQEYKKSLTSDIQLLYLKQEQLWHETVISNDNESTIKKKLLLLKKELQDYLFSLKPTEDKTKIQKREKKLNEIFQQKISTLFNQLKSDLVKKQPKIQSICDMIEQSFYSYLKQIKIEEQPYSINPVKYEAELCYKYPEASLDEQEEKCKQIAKTYLSQYFQIDNNIKIYSGLQTLRLKDQQQQTVNLNKSSYNQQKKINTELLDKQKKQFQKEKDQGTLRKIYNYFFLPKEKNESFYFNQNFALAQQQQEQTRINNIQLNNQCLQQNEIEVQEDAIYELKICFFTFIHDQQEDLLKEKETQESIIRKMHTMIDSVTHDLQQYNFEFTQRFKIDILVCYLFRSFVQYQIQRIKNHQNEIIKYFEVRAKDLKDKILTMIKEGMDEKKNMNELIDCINNNIANTISFKFKSNVETNLRQESLNISPVDLNIQCYSSFGSDSCTRHDVQQFIDNFYEYRRNINKNLLKNIKDNIVQRQENSMLQEIKNQHAIFVQKLIFLHKIYSYLDISQLDQNKTNKAGEYLAENCIAIFTGNKNKYYESLQKLITQYQQNAEIDNFKSLESQFEESIVFNQACKSQDPTLIEINQPKEFIEKFIKLFSGQTTQYISLDSSDILKSLEETNAQKVIALYKQTSQYKEIIEFTENKYQEYLIIDKCCSDICPFCSQPCQLEKGHSGKHSIQYHSYMAFKGVFEIDEDQKNQFVFDYCNSETNVSKFFRKTNIDSKQLTERISQYSLNTNNLFFCLTWYNIHDLDLYVKCPCGSTIYYGTKECSTCKTYLQIDMNVNLPYTNKPVEHVFLKRLPEPNQKFEFWVQWAQSGRSGPDQCDFNVQVVQEGGSTIQEYKDTLERNKTKSNVYSYFTKQCGIQFQEYMHQNYPSWTIIKSDQPSQQDWVQRQQKVWKLIGDEISKKYQIQNKPPF